MITVLIIDDDEHMRKACSRVLSAQGWSVLCAETGDEGLALLKNGEKKIDVILLDNLMPGMSGMDVLAQVKTLDPAVPVIMITGCVTEEYSAEITSMGASGCLPKPFTPAQLRETIKKVVQ